MGILQGVTFTGVDSRTDLVCMVELSRQYPQVEWGILGSKNKQGQAPRYPHVRTVAGVLASCIEAAKWPVHVSLHLCGEWARNVAHYGRDAEVSYLIYLARASRFQVNVSGVTREDVERVESFAQSCRTLSPLRGVRAILQCRDNYFPPQSDLVEWLHDGSGGRGIETFNSWAGSGDSQYVGYAGGITPDNVTRAYARARELTSPDAKFWLDMETGVRTNDWLDLDKCANVCKSLFGDGA